MVEHQDEAGRMTSCFLGKYEAIFKPYILTKKMWTHKVRCLLVQKDEGYGIMISAFQSREFVFWYPLTVPDLQTINEYQSTHPIYVDTDKLTNILGNTHKVPITMGRYPFCQDLNMV